MDEISYVIDPGDEKAYGPFGSFDAAEDWILEQDAHMRRWGLSREGKPKLYPCFKPEEYEGGTYGE